MNPPSDAEQLLADVLADTSGAAFRDRALDQTLCLVRRQSAARRRRQTGAGLLLAVAGCFALWQGLTRSSAPRSQTATVPAAPPARLVQVQSAPLSPSQLVVTGSSTVDSFSSTPGSFILVESGPRGRTVQDVDDTQLLSQLAGHRVALVRFPDRRPELILLDPAELADLPAP